MKKRSIVLVILSLCSCSSLWASDVPSAGGRVEKNVFIEMRDGARLATDVYFPDSFAGARAPTILMRTPYNKERYAKQHADPQSILRFFTRHGYVVVAQDKRGRFASEGRYVTSGGDANDGYDTVDWLAAQPWSNGNVGAYGCSYQGDVQIFMAQTKHPALKALIPQASGSSVGSLGGNYRYFGSRNGGAVEWAQSIGWFAKNGGKYFARLPADLPRDKYNATAAHWPNERQAPTVDFWKAAWHLPMKDALAAQGLIFTDFEDNVASAPTSSYWDALPYMTESYRSDVPALFINSWYDFGADMTLLQFNHFREHSVSKLARENQFAIISPHTHCGSELDAAQEALAGDREVGDTRYDYRTTYLTWFDAWLKGSKSAQQAIGGWPKVRYYAMGENRWRETSGWPAPGVVEKMYYLESGGRANSLYGDGVLLGEPPAADASAFDSYTYDPANPTPSRGGSMCCTGTPDARSGALDQRPVEARADVLVYTSEVLAGDLDVTGDPRAVLYVSSDAVDTDFTVKLVDVYPDGRAFNVLESIIRARYRQGQDKEVWMEPGQVYEVTIPLGATSNVFKAGHRIRLEVASSNFPRFDRNLNLGGVNANLSTWKIAVNKVHHDDGQRSRLVLPVLGGVTARDQRN